MRKYFLIFSLIFLTLNFILLDAWFVKSIFFPKKVIPPKNVDQKIISPECSFSCPQSCVSAIENATSSMKLQTSQTSQVVVTQIVAPTGMDKPINEYIFNFGGSVWTSSDWQSVPDLVGSFNPSQYGQIKAIYFEVVAHLSNENTSASVRLFNNSDKKVVAGSEVNFNSMKCQPMTSVPINLDGNSKEYQVQVKGTENATVYIDAARLRIVTQ